MTCAKCGQVHDPKLADCHRTDGQPCGNRPMRGQRVCSTHGGRSQQAKAAAERRQREERAGEAVKALLHDPDAAPVVDAVAELQRLAGVVRTAADVVGAKVSADRLDGVDVAVWRQLLELCHRVLTDIARLGIEDRAQRATERGLDVLSEVLSWRDRWLGLADDPRAAVLLVVGLEALSEGRMPSDEDARAALEAGAGA